MEALTFDAGLTVWTLVTFGCLLLVLARFVFRPFQRLLQQREDGIRKTLADSEQARQEAGQLLQRQSELLAAARDETRRIVNDGNKVVADMRREAQQKAREEADRIVNQAREELEREVRRSLDELKTTVADLAVRVSRQIIKEQLDEPAHARLADEFVERLKQRHAASPKP